MISELEVSVLSPLHIWSGEKLVRDFDFVFKGGKACFLDVDRLLKQIPKERLESLEPPTRLIPPSQLRNFW